MRLLVIEDDDTLRESLAGQLGEAGYAVEQAADGREGLYFALEYPVDLAIIDLGLPEVSGLDIIREARDKGKTYPILILTARDRWEDKVDGLSAGADDYLIKPFSVDQLEARVRAVLRRSGGEGRQAPLTVGDLVIDVAAREARLGGEPIDLSPKEFDVLRFLAERVGEVVSKRELLAEVWRQPYGGSEKTVDVHISWLRKKLGESAAESRYLQTVFGVGVKLVAPEE